MSSSTGLIPVDGQKQATGPVTEKTHLLPPRTSSSQSDIPSDYDESENDDILSRCREILYISHFLNQFSEISWQFCLVLFLAAFTDYTSLILVSSYGLVSGLSITCFGPLAGKFIDDSNRLLVARRFIGFENLSVLLATFFCYILLSNSDDKIGNDVSTEDISIWQGVPTDPLSIVLLLGIHVLGAAASILDGAFIVAIERDWIVVMSTFLRRPNLSESELLTAQKQWLSETNVKMKQIDLSCKVVAPAIAGFIVGLVDDGTQSHHGHDLRGATLFVGCLNVVALLIEYICVTKIYNSIPDMAVKKTVCESVESDGHCVTKIPDGNGKEITLTPVSKKYRYPFLPRSLSIYLEQSVSFAGITLGLLYPNVLTFGPVMTAYLVWRGMRMDSIGVWRGISSAAGLSGTFVYQIMAPRMGLFKLGMLMQEYVSEEVRGLVGGVQQSLNAFVMLVPFALGLIMPDPEDFQIYATIGYASVGMAVLTFAAGVIRRGGEY